MALSLVCCTRCRKSFITVNHHINENKKLNNFYCSFLCQYYRRKPVTLICENKPCKNKFRRTPGSFSRHNYCSQSCAAISNNIKKWGLSAPKIILNEEERRIRKLAGSKLGGINRWLNYHSKYTKESVVLEIQDFVSQNSRLPVKREMQRLYVRARENFGTWNKAIEAAGFKPNPVLFAEHQVAEDGHKCDSIAEKIIDDYLYKEGIRHERNFPYPGRKYTADFKVRDKIVEYFGLAGEHERYDQLRKIKMDIAKRLNLKLIIIYPEDLYSSGGLNRVLGTKLSQYSFGTRSMEYIEGY